MGFHRGHFDVESPLERWREMIRAGSGALGAILLLWAAGQAVQTHPAKGQWPQFRGPNRDEISAETGLLKKWPAEGPKLLWTARGIGEGYSTVAVAGGLIYTTGNIGADTVITALDLGGKVRWRANNGPAYKRDKPGTRSTPTIDNNRLYHQNADGDVVCLESRSGKSIWSLNVLKKFNGRNISWALAESLLIDGNNVICTTGGKDVGMVALDKSDGRTVWTCKGPGDKPAYCSPIVFEYKGIRQIVTMMAKAVIGVNAGTGKLLWRFGHVTPFDENINSPIFHDGCVFFTSRTTGSRLLRLNVAGDEVSVQKVWQSRNLDSQHGGVVLLDGYLYGACMTAGRGPWVCLEFKTGKRMYAERGINTGSLTYADGMLYLLNHNRTAALVPATPRAFEIVSRFNIPRAGRGPSWAHPVVCGGRLYIRHGDYLYAFDIKAKN